MTNRSFCDTPLRRDMVADIFTKYLRVVVWLRHVAYLLNDAVRAVRDVTW